MKKYQSQSNQLPHTRDCVALSAAHVKLKTAIVLLVAFALGGVIIGAFWFQDWQYALPTPRPVGLVQPVLHSVVAPTSAILSVPVSDGRPLFLHFFNPNCPCSRFNLDHVRELVKIYGTRVRFVAIVETLPSPDPALHLQSFGLPMQAVADTDGWLARRYGVYSTPQAVLIGADGKLDYRGNYNVSRYCTDHSTEFARQALDALLALHPLHSLSPEATIAYGCSLPSAPVSPSVDTASLFTRFCASRGRKP